MIIYRPTDGDVLISKVNTRPRTCFVMTQLGGKVSQEAAEIRRVLRRVMRQRNMREIDASSVITGKDFLLKIWELMVAVPLGVAVIDETMSCNTLCNVYYEIGLMQALGKETLVIKTERASIPSNLVRTEYIQHGDNLANSIRKFLDAFFERSAYYEHLSGQLERNPLLAIDYLRRAFLISGESRLRREAKRYRKEAVLDERARNSVEKLLVEF